MDYVPSIYVFRSNVKSSSERQNEWHHQLQKRREKAVELEATVAAADALVYTSEVKSPSVPATVTANVYTQTASPSSVAQGIQVCAPTQARCVQACPSVI